MNHYPLLQADMDTLADHLSIAVYDINQELRMSAIDRIKAKALQARAVVPDAIKAVEADLDSIIGQTAVIDKKRAEATAPHKEAVAGLMGELDGLKDALDVLSNGGPPLDESPTSAPASVPPALPAVDAIVDDTGNVVRPKLSI